MKPPNVCVYDADKSEETIAAPPSDQQEKQDGGSEEPREWIIIAEIVQRLFFVMFSVVNIGTLLYIFIKFQWI